MKPFYNSICRFALVSVMALPMMTVSTPSKANVTITPTIAVIEGRDRFADLNLINVTNVPHTYTVGWVFMKMVGEDGKYENLDKSITDFDLTKNIVFTPKRVTIESEGLQKIRLGLRLKGEPPAPGDYRAHLSLTDVGGANIQGAEQQHAQAEKDKPAGASAVTVGVHVNVGFSVPVVYRVGESTAVPVIGTVTTGVDQLGRPEVTVPVTKTGGETYGVLGRLQVVYNDKVVGEVRNANIFPEIKNRVYKIPLMIPKLSGGSVRIVYRHYDTNSDVIYAEKTIPVGQ
jgi:hypothetical protein